MPWAANLTVLIESSNHPEPWPRHGQMSAPARGKYPASYCSCARSLVRVPTRIGSDVYHMVIDVTYTLDLMCLLLMHREGPRGPAYLITDGPHHVQRQRMRS